MISISILTSCVAYLVSAVEMVRNADRCASPLPYHERDDPSGAYTNGYSYQLARPCTSVPQGRFQSVWFVSGAKRMMWAVLRLSLKCGRKRGIRRYAAEGDDGFGHDLGDCDCVSGICGDIYLNGKFYLREVDVACRWSGGA